jgi:hypothetical protein
MNPSALRPLELLVDGQTSLGTIINSIQGLTVRKLSSCMYMWSMTLVGGVVRKNDGGVTGRC